MFVCFTSDWIRVTENKVIFVICFGFFTIVVVRVRNNHVVYVLHVKVIKTLPAPHLSGPNIIVNGVLSLKSTRSSSDSSSSFI